MNIVCTVLLIFDLIVTNQSIPILAVLSQSLGFYSHFCQRTAFILCTVVHANNFIHPFLFVLDCWMLYCIEFV